MKMRWLSNVPMLMSPDDPTSGGAPAGGGSTGTPPASGGQQPPADPPKFTQADVDRLLGDRAKRAEESTQKQILEALGVSSLDDLKKIKEDADKARKSQMSELEKAQNEAKEAQAKIDKANADREAALQQANEMLMRSAVLAEATKADYRIRPEAMTDIWSFISADKALLEKIKAVEGKPGEFSGIGDALKDLLKAKVYMVDNGNGNGTPRKPARKNNNDSEPSQEERERSSRRATHNKF